MMDTGSPPFGILIGRASATRVASPLAFFMVVFAPGYVTLGALFPRRDEISWNERIAFSFGLSIATVAVLGLLLDVTPVGIRFSSIVLAIAVFTVVVGAIAYWRRGTLPGAERLALALDIHLPVWGEYEPA